MLLVVVLVMLQALTAPPVPVVKRALPLPVDDATVLFPNGYGGDKDDEEVVAVLFTARTWIDGSSHVVLQ